jgi:hypothetical protein
LNEANFTKQFKKFNDLTQWLNQSYSSLQYAKLEQKLPYEETSMQKAFKELNDFVCKSYYVDYVNTVLNGIFPDQF